MGAYLDNAATAPMRPEARAVFDAARDLVLGNPSGVHRASRRARALIEEARDVVATAAGVAARHVVFTSGGTEADNLAVLGVHDRLGGTLVCGATEHHAVLDPVQARGGRTVGVDRLGVVRPDALAEELEAVRADGGEVTLVSVMAVNNEVGTVQPVAELAEVARRHAPGALVHTDAAQAVSYVPLDELAGPVDLCTFSGHKFGGPVGVGALVVRSDDVLDALAPRQLGGGQERGWRSGTPDAVAISALGAALTALAGTRADEVVRTGRLRADLVTRLVAGVEGLVVTGAPEGDPARLDETTVPGICHVCVPGVASESMLYLLDREGVAASSASSCASGAIRSSHVLAAMGLDAGLAAGSLRLSLGWATTAEDVVAGADAVVSAVAQLRAVPEQAVPEQAVPEQAVPEQAVPEQAVSAR